jgi:hypothetical protein
LRFGTSTTLLRAFGPFTPWVPLSINGTRFFVTSLGLARNSLAGIATMLGLDALAFSGLLSSTANFVANAPFSPWLVDSIDRTRLLFTRNCFGGVAFALFPSVLGCGEVALSGSPSDSISTRNRASAIFGPFAPATVNNAFNLHWSFGAGVGVFGGGVFAREDRIFVSAANDVGDQESLRGGPAGGDASSTDIAHLTTSDITNLLLDGFAANGEESVSFGVEDFQLALTKLRTAQTDRVLAGQTIARGYLFGRTHASSVLTNAALILTRSFPLLYSLTASLGSVANGPGSPFAEEGTDSLVAGQKFHIRSVAIQGASGCFGGGIDAPSSSDLDSFVAAHRALAISRPGGPFGRRSLLLAVLSLPLGVDADTFVLSSSSSVAAFDASSVVFAGIRFAEAKGFAVNAHVGASVISGAVLGFQILWVCFIGVVVENTSRSLKQHVEGFTSRVFDTHLCAE